MFEEGKKGEELIVPPFQDADLWVRSAESANEEMDEGLKEALASIAVASAETEEKTSKAVKELQETGKTLTGEVRKAIADFSEAIGQGFARMWHGVTSAFDSVGAKIGWVFKRDGRSQEEETAAAVSAERVTKAYDAFRRAMQEAKAGFEASVEKAEQKVDQELIDVGEALDQADSISKVRTALGGLQNAALGNVDGVEAAIEAAVAGMRAGFAEYDEQVRYASKVLDGQEQQVVDSALEGLGGKVGAEVHEFKQKAATALSAARSEAKGLVARAMQIVVERESAEVGRVQESIKASADIVQQAFEGFFRGMTDRLTSLSSTLGDRSDTVIDKIVSKKVSREDEQTLRALVSDAKTESQVAVGKGYEAAIVAAQEAVRDAVTTLHEKVDNLKDVGSLRTVKDILLEFQEQTVKIAETAMNAVKEARGTVLERAHKFAEEVSRAVGTSLDEKPRKQLHRHLDKLQKEMEKQTKTSMKEELGQFRAVVRQADKEMQRTIAAIPYKGLAAIPYKGVGAQIRQVTANWEAQEGMGSAAALREIEERTATTETRLTMAFEGLKDSISRSNEAIARAFKGFLEVVGQAFKNMAQSVAGLFTDIALKTPEAKGVLEDLKSGLEERAGLVDEALKEVEQQIDQALGAANQEVENVEDLGAVQKVLENFQESATVAMSGALNTVETQVSSIERDVRELGKGGGTGLESLREAVVAALDNFKGTVSTELRTVGETVREVEEVVLTAIEEVAEAKSGSEIVPLKGLDQWVDEAHVTSATMDPALKEALVSMAAAGSETEENTAEAVETLQETGKESARRVSEALANFFEAIAQSFVNMWNGITSGTSALGTKISAAFLRHQLPTALAIGSEQLDRARDAFTQALKEEREGFEAALQGAEGKAEQGAQDAMQQLDEANSIANVRDALNGLQDTALGAIHAVETAAEAVVSGMQQDFREYTAGVESSAAALTDAGRREVAEALEGFGEHMQAEVQQFRAASAATVLEGDRASAKGPVERTMEIISNRESAEIASVRENVMAAAGGIQRAFSTFFGGALRQMVDNAAEIHERMDDMVKDHINYKVNLTAEKGMRDAVTMVHRGIHKAVDDVFWHIRDVAEYSMRNAISNLQSQVDSLGGVHELESVRDMLHTFQEGTVKIMDDVLTQISEGRTAVASEVAKFQEQARDVGKNLDVQPQKDLEKALDQFQKDLTRQDTEALKGELEQARVMVRRADREMRQTIRGMPYKALAAIPYKGVSYMLKDALRDAGLPGWEALMQEVRERSVATGRGLVGAFSRLQDFICASNERVVEVLGNFFKAVSAALKNATQSVIALFRVATAGWEGVRTAIRAQGEEAESILSGAEQQLYQAAQEVKAAVAGATDLCDVGQALENFQETAAVAVGSALGDMNAGLSGIEGTILGFSPEDLTAEQEAMLTACKEEALEEVANLRTEVREQVRAAGKAIAEADKDVRVAIGQQAVEQQQSQAQSREEARLKAVAVLHHDPEVQKALEKAAEGFGEIFVLNQNQEQPEGRTASSVEEAGRGLSDALKEAQNLPDQPDQQQQQGGGRGIGGIGR